MTIEKKVFIICGQEFVSERKDGGKKCSYRNYELLKRIFGEENVYLCMFTNQSGSEGHIIRRPAHKNKMDRICNILSGHLFTGRSVEEEILQIIEKKKIDIVFFERSMFGKVAREIRRRHLQCSIWVFVHNVERKYFGNRLKQHKILYLLPYLMIARSERQTLALADYIITLTERDSKMIKQLYGITSDLVLPMTFEDQCNEEKIDKQCHFDRNMLFIGSMFPPNYDGIKWFVDYVMSELPEYHLIIVGKDFEKEKVSLEKSNVKVIGTVDDLKEFYYANNIMIMPIFYGDGIKIKTAEAMMYGKVILATDEALEGYDVEGVAGIYRCNSKQEFIRQIKNIYEGKCRCFSPQVRNLFIEKYTVEKQAELCRKQWG